MTTVNYKYIFGPVPSWRLGASLGIDPVSKGRKVCSFDCAYCQIGKTRFLNKERKNFIEAKKIIDEIATLPLLHIDYITFSGAGEPTLAKNLSEMIQGVRKIRKEKISVITNSSLFDDENVREDLLLADFVIAKLDAPVQSVFEQVNYPMPGIHLKRIIDGLKIFRQAYKKKLALQIMFIARNKKYAKEIAQIAKEINPDEVQINTPLRHCDVSPLSKVEISGLEKYFDGLKTISVYEAEIQKINSISDEATLKRRGKI